MAEYHSLLRRQVKKHFGNNNAASEGLSEFLQAVDSAYRQSDSDRTLLERTIEFSSNELMEVYSDLRAILEVLPDLFFRLDKQGKILDCKAGASTDFHLPRESLIGKYIHDIPFPEIGAKIAATLQVVSVTQKMASIEYSSQVKDHTSYYEARILPMQNGQMVTVVRNITERKDAEIALREGEARLRLIIDTAFDAIIGTNGSGQIVVWNPQAESTFGWSHDDAIGRSFTETIIPEKDRATYEQEMSNFLKHGRSNVLGRRIEITATHKNGSELPVELAISPIKFSGVVFFSAFVRDISERKRLQEDRELMEIQLRHAQKLEAIGHLAAGVAHEINTPTQYIGDNTRFIDATFRDIEKIFDAQQHLLEAAQEKNFAPDLVAASLSAHKAADLNFLRSEIPNAIKQALEGVEQITSIVRAMKDFSHPGTNVKIAVDLNKAIENTLTVCRNEWKYVADLATKFEPDLPAIMCIPGEFNQVILNIIVNAAHAIVEANKDGTKGTITVETLQVGDWVEIRISDTGAGIQEEVKGKVFDPFFTTKEVGKGTGQGLSIARSIIVDKHQGTISFTSQKGKGTTFVIQMPLHINEIVHA